MSEVGQAGESKATEELTERLLGRFASPKYVPPMLPAVALEVHALAHRSNSDIAKVIAILERDPLLAARVLKVASSAAFAASGTIASLREAVVRVGMRNLSEIAWEVAFDMRVFRSVKYGGLMEGVQRHSTACAHLTRLVASFTLVESELGFLCGLLHDVGMAAALIEFDEPKAGAPVPADGLVGSVLQRCHVEASRMVARLWKLPEDVQAVVGQHHGGADLEAMSPLTATLIVADDLANELGAGVELLGSNLDLTEARALEHARKLLTLDDTRMAALRAEARRLSAGFGRAAAGAAGEAKAEPRPTEPAPRPVVGKAPLTAARSPARTLMAITRKLFRR